MRRWLMAGAMLGAAAVAPAQTHVVKETQQVVRAVGVFEWTGDEGKPGASRLVPVSLFINGQFEDAGIYLPRPVPFALDTGTIFDLEKAGVPEGRVEIAVERNFESNGIPQFDQGWMGYGPVKLNPKEAPVMSNRRSGPLPQVVASGGKGPRFSSKPDTDGKSGTKPDAQPDANPGAGTVDRSTAAGAGTTVDAGREPDPAGGDGAKHPTMRRRPDAADADSSGSTASADGAEKSGDAGRGRPGRADAAEDDADRPTLKRRTPAERKDAQKKAAQASVTGGTALNDDPDRPTLHRGKAVGEAFAALKGIPSDMHQAVAVSDAQDRPEHDFARPWESEAERAEVLAMMRAMALEELAKYGGAAPAGAAAVPAPLRTTAGRRAAAVRKPAPAPVAAVPLTGESVRGFTLSFGGAPTYFYTASSPGAEGAVRYVAVAAQQEPGGELKAALKSVTDSTHLDRNPWMRLVDVVDADASNRASLLVELRAQNSRQFALYRLIGAKAEQVFVTSTPQ